MNFLKQISRLVFAACLGLALVGCQPSDPKSPKVAQVTSLAVTPSPVTLEVGGVQPLTATATFTDGSSYIVNFWSTFASSAPAVAKVDPATGYVTALAAGTATITATHTQSGKTATTLVTVLPLRVVSIAVTPATNALTVGATQALTVTATYNNTTTGPVTAGSTFSSSNPTAATVNAAGVVSAVAPGSATITATHTASGKVGTATVTVSVPPVGGGGFRPITFDEPGVAYTLTGFGGAEDSTVVPDPANASNMVAKVVKSATAEVWAGTTVSTGPNQSVDKIPFTATSTKMTVRVYSPRAGIPVRLKVEDAADGTRSVETEATTTVANAWQTLTFDFANPAAGTAALNPAYTYNKVSIFFDFGKSGAAGGGGTFYFDDVAFAAGAGTSGFTPITFDTAGVTYTLTGFGGAEDATVVADPANASNKLAKVVKSATAEVWAGTTVSTGPNQSVDKIPFTATSTKMTVRVYSPRAGIPVRLKVEDAADGARSVETEATTTVANAWQTLTFDFANPAAGTAALNLAYTYNKVSIFFDFGKSGAAGGGGTFYFDDVAFAAGAGTSGFTPITFDTAGVTYTLTGFGGAEDATVVADPGNASNKVAKVVKSATAEVWAGTTVSTGPNQSVDKIPFTATRTKMTVRVYSPRAGIPVRLKVEDAADGTRSVETEATTTVANAWQTLTFDFANPAAGTAALNLAYTYNKVSIFFDFGKSGAAGGGGTFYFDDVAFN